MAKCKLGDFVFDIAPEREIDIDDGREIAKLDVPGGAPRYQDMGPSEKIASWSGILEGNNAYEQSKKIEALMYKGWIPWRYGTISETVRIKSFKKKIIRFDRIRYSIELIVKTNNPAVKTATNKVASSTSVKSSTDKDKGTSQRTYIVRQGDTLWELAEKYYGKGTLWEQIAKANKIKNPRALKVGQKIIIP